MNPLREPLTCRKLTFIAVNLEPVYKLAVTSTLPFVSGRYATQALGTNPQSDENILNSSLDTESLALYQVSVRRLKSFATPFPPPLTLLLLAFGSLHLVVTTHDRTFTGKICACPNRVGVYPLVE